MLVKPHQVGNSNSAQILFRRPRKPFVHGDGASSTFRILSLPEQHKSTGSHRIRISLGTIKAVASSPSTHHEESSRSTHHHEESTDETEAITVKAVVTVQPTVTGFFKNLGIDRGLDDIQDLLGKTLLLELVSAELDPKTGLEKETVQGYAHKIGRKEDGIKYETSFKVPINFGEVGAVLVENEHHKEMYLTDIVLDGLRNGPINVICGSWVHSKFDSPEKRVFFTSKSYLPSETPSGLRRLREEELATLRGNGEGERKHFERIYDYDVYNDIGDPDKNLKLTRPVLGGEENPYPRRCRTGRPPCESGLKFIRID
ncbi:Lipoxygenase [Trema orientale]|uniref:Lipoxygenase n=1 Tax=Trema orientale TaxID=63057 RepID=A0A2P5BS97_TREOI|nr:Lipoxygenase [Trema orientale]